jgi:hypothetical protein
MIPEDVSVVEVAAEFPPFTTDSLNINVVLYRDEMALDG